MRKRVTAGAILSVLLVLGFGMAFAVYKGYFHVNERAAGKYPIKGVDVSHYQGEIDWEILSGQGIRFAYIKATEGSSYIDDTFAQNYDDARKTELKVGAYHFFSFDSPGISQAEHFIRTVEAFGGMLPPVVDVEFYGDKKEHPPDADKVETDLRECLKGMEQVYERKPVIYATLESWELYIKGRFDEYPLWIRDIWKEPALESGWEDGEERGWTFWQYTNRGRLKGFLGEEEYIDLNVFYGNEEQWNQFCVDKVKN